MDEYLKALIAGLTEGAIKGFAQPIFIEHSSEDGGRLEISGDYSSTTQHTGLHLRGAGARIVVSGNARIIQKG